MKRAPSTATLYKVMAEMTKEINTPKMVTLWLTPRPMRRPPKAVPKMPARAEPSSGAKGTIKSWVAFKVLFMMWSGQCCQPLRLSSSSTWMLVLLRNNKTKMARPMADSAAATVRIKKTNTWPCRSPKK